MDANAAVFDRAEYRAEYAALATDWRDLAVIARQQDRYATALETQLNAR